MLTASQVSNARNLEELVVRLHGTRCPVRRRYRVVVAKVLRLGLGCHASRAGGCRRARLHRDNGRGSKLGLGWRELFRPRLRIMHFTSVDIYCVFQGTFG